MTSATESSICAIVLIICLIVPSNVFASSIYKEKGVGITIESTLVKSGKLKYSDLISYDNSTSYSGGFIKKDDDIRRYTIPQHNNIGPYQFTNKFYVIVDPPTGIQNRLPLITIVSNLDSYHTQAQKKTNEVRVSADAKAHAFVISSYTARWVDDGCREAKIEYKSWQILLPDTINYLKSGCDISSTKIKILVNQTKILTKHDLPTSAKYKLDNFYQNVKHDCTKARNSCIVENRQVSTMGDSR